jgi:hypothetical protein
MKYNDSPFKPTLNPDHKTTTTRQRVSDIAAKIKPEKILETVLRTPIRLEVLGSDESEGERGEQVIAEGEEEQPAEE